MLSYVDSICDVEALDEVLGTDFTEMYWKCRYSIGSKCKDELSTETWVELDRDHCNRVWIACDRESLEWRRLETAIRMSIGRRCHHESNWNLCLDLMCLSESRKVHCEVQKKFWSKKVQLLGFEVLYFLMRHLNLGDCHPVSDERRAHIEKYITKVPFLVLRVFLGVCQKIYNEDQRFYLVREWAGICEQRIRTARQHILISRRKTFYERMNPTLQLEATKWLGGISYPTYEKRKNRYTTQQHTISKRARLAIR